MTTGEIRPVDRPAGTPDRTMTITKRRGKWEVHEGLKLDYPLVPDHHPEPEIVDLAKTRDRSTSLPRFNYSQVNLFTDENTVL